MTTITFLGERQDIIDPDAAVTAARQTPERVNGNQRRPPTSYVAVITSLCLSTRGAK
jgi:hypothetical protein